MNSVRRRDFIALTVAATASTVLPRLALGQQNALPPGTKRLGVIWAFDEDNQADILQRETPFLAGLAAQDRLDGRNLHIDTRWGGRTADLARPLVAQVIDLRPDVIVAHTIVPAREAVKQTQSIPIVFAALGVDPVTSGLVGNFVRPDANVTGTMTQPPSLAGKHVELLKELLPTLKTAAFLYSPDSGTTDDITQRVTPFLTACAANDIDPITVPIRTDDDVTRALAMLGAGDDRGVILVNDSTITGFYTTILAGLARYRLPVVYPNPFWEAYAGIVCYYADVSQPFELAGEYAGRILNGTKIADLPVQYPTKYTLSVNLKTAAALGITIPPSILARADKVTA